MKNRTCCKSLLRWTAVGGLPFLVLLLSGWASACYRSGLELIGKSRSPQSQATTVWYAGYAPLSAVAASRCGHQTPPLRGPEGSLVVASTLEGLREAGSRSSDGAVVYLQGYSWPGDGGQGWFVLDTAPAIVNQRPDDGVLVIAAHGLPGARFLRLHVGTLSIRAAGAQGDGRTDDTAAIQRVLDTGLSVVGDGPGSVYVVGRARTSRCVDSELAGLVIHSGQHLDLHGATLRLAPGVNRSVLVNHSLFNRLKRWHCPNAPPVEPDRDIGISNAVIDGNVEQQVLPRTAAYLGRTGVPYAPAVWFADVVGVELRNVEVRNYYSTGIRLDASSVSLDDVSVENGRGPGLHLDGERYRARGLRVRGARFFERDDLSPGRDPAFWGAQPNALALDVRDSDFEDIEYDDCDWAMKIQGTSARDHFGRIVSHASHTIGLKIQGKAHGPPERDDIVRDVSVDDLSVDGSAGMGVYVFLARDIRVGRYRGTNNGWSASLPLHVDGWQLGQPGVPRGRVCDDWKDCCDVRVLGSSIEVGVLESTGTKQFVLTSGDWPNGVPVGQQRPSDVKVTQLVAVGPARGLFYGVSGTAAIGKAEVFGLQDHSLARLVYLEANPPGGKLWIGSLKGLEAWDGDSAALVHTGSAAIPAGSFWSVVVGQ